MLATLDCRNRIGTEQSTGDASAHYMPQEALAETGSPRDFWKGLCVSQRMDRCVADGCQQTGRAAGSARLRPRFLEVDDDCARLRLMEWRIASRSIQCVCATRIAGSVGGSIAQVLAYCSAFHRLLEWWNGSEAQRFAFWHQGTTWSEDCTTRTEAAGQQLRAYHSCRDRSAGCASEASGRTTAELTLRRVKQSMQTSFTRAASTRGDWATLSYPEESSRTGARFPALVEALVAVVRSRHSAQGELVVTEGRAAVGRRSRAERAGALTTTRLRSQNRSRS